MATQYFQASTLDDALRLAFEAILRDGVRVEPRKGPNLEIMGAVVEIFNPRARLSITETRGRPFGCLGELCWYLAGTRDTEFITYYLSRYQEFDEGGEIFGGYGPRLFDWRNVKQYANVIATLRERPTSRQAVVQLFDATDLSEPHKDVPCTCTMQFLIRNNCLNLITHMRSNDAFVGLPHDVFCFTMLQEIVARDLGIDLGIYKHMAGSFHIYESDLNKAEQFLAEGWQSTEEAMPAMPIGDPWPGIGILLDAEREIRSIGSFDDAKLNAADPYWLDLIRLLQVYRCRKMNDSAGLIALRERISKTYLPFIDRLTQVQ